MGWTWTEIRRSKDPSFDGKVKDDGRDEAIRYEALTKFDLKGWVTRVLVSGVQFGIGIVRDPGVDLYHLRQSQLPRRKSRWKRALDEESLLE